MAFEQLPFDPAMETLIRLVATAELRIQAAIKDAIVRGASGTLAYRRRRLMAIRRELAELQQQLDTRAQTLVQESFNVGVRVAGGKELLATFGTGTSELAVQELVRNLVGSLDGAVHTLGRQAEDAIRRASLRETALHLIEGSTHGEAAAALRAALEKGGITAFVDRAGRQWSMSNYTSMVIRTTTREAVSAGTKRGMTATGRDLVEIFEHAHPCDICEPYRGNTYSLSGRVPGYPVLLEMPPFHPRCRCVAGPAKANFEALEAELSSLPVAAAS